MVVSLAASLDRRAAKVGDSFTATVDRPVVVGDRIVVPQGSEAKGHVASLKRPSRLKQIGLVPLRSTGQIDLALDQITTPDGVKYSISGRETATEDARYLVLIPPGYGLAFTIDKCELVQEPAQIPVSEAKQQTPQTRALSERTESASGAPAQSPPANNHSGLLPPGKPVQAQFPLTPAQAQETAQELLGKRPDRVDRYVSEEEKTAYIAFSSETPRVWLEAEKTSKPGYEEVWIYKQVPGVDRLQQVWYERSLWPDLDYWSLDGFVSIPSEKSPLLRLQATWHGATGCGGTRLGVYSISWDKLFWIDYQQDCGAFGEPKLIIDESQASDYQPIRKFLKDWGHEQDEKGHLRSHSLNPEMEKFEQMWIDANVQRPCPDDWALLSSRTTWKASGTAKLMPYRSRDLYGNPHIVLDDGQYQWLSYFKGGVGEYDTHTRQYSLVYLPQSRYYWSQKIVIIGSWVYIQDCDHWAVRFNKNTHTIERGDFGSIVGLLDSGVYPTTPLATPPPLASTQKKEATVPLIHAYDLLKNPFAFRGREVQLDVESWPWILNGAVYRWNPMVSSVMTGIRFERMISENEALYDVMALDINDADSGLRPIGQLIVLIPSPSQEPRPGSLWLVRPLGVATGSNYFGAVIQTPKVQFLRYVDQ
jgi:hypothetical protein